MKPIPYIPQGTLRRDRLGGYITRKGHTLKKRDGQWYIHDHRGHVYDHHKELRELRDRYA
jgi:hypothetical protein